MCMHTHAQANTKNQTDRHTHIRIHTNEQTDRHINKQTDRQTQTHATLTLDLYAQFNLKFTQTRLEAWGFIKEMWHLIILHIFLFIIILLFEWFLFKNTVLYFTVCFFFLKLIYRSGTVNSNVVNSKFHLIRSFCEIFARFLSFHVYNAWLFQTQLIQSSTGV